MKAKFVRKPAGLGARAWRPIYPKRAEAAFDGEKRLASGHKCRGGRIQLCDLDRYCHLRPEFLRLNKSTRGECLSRNPSWKAKVIVDARTGSCLPTKRARLKDDRGAALGCGVDGSRKTSRPSTDDRHVVRTIGVIDAPHPEGTGQRDFAGVLENCSFRADRLTAARRHSQRIAL